jgi:hypothetical protein
LLEAIEAPLMTKIRQTVEAEFAEQLAASGSVRYIRVCIAIEREVKRRYREELGEQAPPGALY